MRLTTYRCCLCVFVFSLQIKGLSAAPQRISILTHIRRPLMTPHCPLTPHWHLLTPSPLIFITLPSAFNSSSLWPLNTSSLPLKAFPSPFVAFPSLYAPSDASSLPLKASPWHLNASTSILISFCRHLMHLYHPSLFNHYLLMHHVIF